MTTQLRQSPLDAVHHELGATMAEFGGWQMPIQYPTGVVAEHAAVRTTVGLFDVSHLGHLSVTGSRADEFVNTCLTNDLDRIEPGQAQYTLCCDEDGGVIDDVIAYYVDREEIDLVPNAANAAEVYRRIKRAAPRRLQVRNLHEETAYVAVQGPDSANLLKALGLGTRFDYMSFQDGGWQNRHIRVCRTGYTGELGYELVVGRDGAEPLWRALLDIAKLWSGIPAGLGARDTLRTEMGYPLHGQDLTPEITPVQAGAGWAVGWMKPRFWGRDVLMAERQARPRRRLRGLKATGRGVPRPGMPVLLDGRQIGQTTSGTFSPTLKTGIALALLDTDAVTFGDQVSVDVRGRPLPCEVVKPPFVESHVR